MSKPLIGLLLGAVLGLADGITGLFSPGTASIIGTIIAYTTIKGVVIGVVTGLVARKVRSLPIGIAVGLVVGFGLSHAVALLASRSLYFDIVLPGAVLGIVVGVATQKYGNPTQASSKPS